VERAFVQKQMERAYDARSRWDGCDALQSLRMRRRVPEVVPDVVSSSAEEPLAIEVPVVSPDIVLPEVEFIVPEVLRPERLLLVPELLIEPDVPELIVPELLLFVEL
jgi:hypothetical protein